MRQPDNPDDISILIATDNHLGYMERDPVRGSDSMETFEEILKIARARNVDFILLGGDLYHDNKPSRKTLHASMALFREYCWGGLVDFNLKIDPVSLSFSQMRRETLGITFPQ